MTFDKFWMNTRVLWVALCIAVVAPTCGYVGCYGAYMNARFAGECRAAGYPESSTTFPPFEGWCYKKVNGTDVMVPVAELP